MKQYIGTKLIEAEPAPKVNGKVQPADWPIPNDATVEPGYKVCYPGGYESWSPRDVFERAYLPLTVNQELKTNRPSISKEVVEDFIVNTWTQTLGNKCTVVRARLRNGFEIVESSACVSPENYDEKLGEAICLDKIKDKVWTLLGFLLQTAVGGVQGLVNKE